MKTISLNGKWNMQSADNAFSCIADVPGSDFGNLIKNNIIKTPLVSGDENEALAVARKDFVFERDFQIDDDVFDSDNIVLYIDCADTLCSGYINDELVFKSENAYLPVECDVKKNLKKGKNNIKICFSSSVNYIEKKFKEKPLMKNGNGVDGIPYIRKSGCHFGWDWGPCVPYNYLGNIEIQCFGRKIDNVRIEQKTSSSLSTVLVSADNADRCRIISPDGDVIESRDMKFEIENPQLWYTRELSQKDEQPLYTVVIENDEMTVEKKIGLRSIELCRDKDEWGSNFQFVLNGERVFAKGANLIPFSAIPEDADNESVDYYLDLAVKSNFNMIRVWGGGAYADEYLLNECDRLGVLVWQDFCFACQMYPLYDDAFVSNVLAEAEYNVKRMNTHPCLALWCGNNEIETMYSYLPKTSQLVKAYEKFFYHTLPDYIQDLTHVPYIPTSPIGTEPFKNYSSDSDGDTHMWNVWHGLKKLNYYEKRYSRFLSEYGLESLPSMKAIKTFAFNNNDFDLSSKAFMSHQKCVGGNRKMLFYLMERFDEPCNFDDLPYLTGIVQAECIKSATEHFRRNKGRCNGSLFWQFNDVWNAPSWSAVDFEGIPKALMYYSKRFFAPVALTYHNSKLYAHNDTMSKKEFDVHIRIYNCDKIKTDKTLSVSVEKDSVKVVDNIILEKGDVMAVDYLDYSICVDNSAKLKPVEFKIVKGKEYIVIESDTFAKNVCIESDALPDDNYFSLMPSQPKTIRFNDSIGKFNIKCENDIKFSKNIIKKKLFRFFYRLEPLNIGNWFWYQFN